MTWPATTLTATLLVVTAPSQAFSGQETPAPATAQPAAPATAEDRLAGEVRAALAQYLGEEAGEIAVLVTGNRAVLTGVVPRRAVQELAKEVALFVPGITRVSNYVELRPRPVSPDTPVAAGVAHAEREVSDGALESRVKMRIASLIGVRARQVEVEAAEGWVSLRGVLPDAETKAMVLRVAEKTPGVARIIDLLRHP